MDFTEFFFRKLRGICDILLIIFQFQELNEIYCIWQHGHFFGRSSGFDIVCWDFFFARAKKGKQFISAIKVVCQTILSPSRLLLHDNLIAFLKSQSICINHQFDALKQHARIHFLFHPHVCVNFIVAKRTRFCSPVHACNFPIFSLAPFLQAI